MITDLYFKERYCSISIDIQEKGIEELKKFVQNFCYDNDIFTNNSSFKEKFLEKLKQFEWYNREAIIECCLTFKGENKWKMEKLNKKEEKWVTEYDN